MTLRKIYPLLLICVLIFLGIAVQYMPTHQEEEHLAKSCQLLKKEGIGPVFFGRSSDNYTDAVMLMISSSKPDEPSLKRFFTSPLYNVSSGKPNWKKLYALHGLCSHEFMHYRITYPRYWHGYQIILRPLLYFTDYPHIRIINKYLQELLFIILIYLFCKNKAYGLILGWFVSCIILNPQALPLNMTYSIIYYITTVSSILLLCFKKKIERHIGWPIFFMMIGICTNFFDFLTYPIASLGIPLTILFYIAPPADFKTMLKNLVLISGCWVLGYAGMWLLRWILSTLITDENVLANAFEAVINRGKSHIKESTYPVGTAITKTFHRLCAQDDTFTTIIISIFLSVVAVLRYSKNCFAYLEKKYFQVLPFFAISFGTIVYCLIVKGHPLQHSNYTFRLWIVFFFAIISGLNFWVLEAQAPKEPNNDR